MYNVIMQRVKNFIYYLLVPLFYLLVALAGRGFTSLGVDTWYPSLIKPSFTPPGSVIGAVWTLIYVLTALSFIIYIMRAKGLPRFRPVIGLYIINGILNAVWSYLFFTKHLMGIAVLDAGLIWLSVFLIIIYAWPASRVSSVLLIPYLGWVSFATFLNYVIYRSNP